MKIMNKTGVRGYIFPRFSYKQYEQCFDSWPSTTRKSWIRKNSEENPWDQDKFEPSLLATKQSWRVLTIRKCPGSSFTVTQKQNFYSLQCNSVFFNLFLGLNPNLWTKAQVNPKNEEEPNPKNVLSNPENFELNPKSSGEPWLKSYGVTESKLLWNQLLIIFK